MPTTEEMLEKMYDSQLNSQKEQLKTDYETALSDMDAKQAAAKKALDQKITDTRVDSQRAAVSNAEYYAAAGLSSGARAQARLSQENQLLSNLTALRAAQMEADNETERQRTLLSKEYAAAIRQAQADNDLQRAQALYQEAKDADAKLLAQQEAAANLMAQTGDYSRLGALYGLTPEEIAKLSGKSSGGSRGGTGSTVNNGSLSEEEIRQLQTALNKQGYGLTVDGLYGAKSQAAAGGLGAAEAYDKYVTYSYSGILAAYIEAADAGAKQRELDAYLRDYIAAGYLTEAQATRLRDDANDVMRNR